MREYPQAAYKVKEEVLKELKSYKTLKEFLDLTGLSLKDVFDFIESGDEIDPDFLELEDEEIDDNKISKLVESAKEGDSQPLADLIGAVEAEFEEKHPEFNIFHVSVDSEAEGDVSGEGFFEVSLKENPLLKVSELVNWTTFG